MAKKVYLANKLPHFGLFLFIALAITLGLTVFAVQKVSTNTQQHAAYNECDPSPCRLTAPTLSVVSSFYTRGDLTCTINMKVKWSAVAHATKYYLYWYSKTLAGNQVGSDTIVTTSTSHTFNVSIPHPGKFYTYVKAYNSYPSTFGPPSETKTLTCPQ